MKLHPCLQGAGRRTICLLALLVVLQVACRRRRSRESETNQPRDVDVLLITLDTTGADHLSCYARSGSKHVAKTPHLDALAAQGVRFTNATVQVPLTLPSHACIMTGAYPEVHGVRDMGGFALSTTHPTIATIAQQAGYGTAAFVGSVVLGKRFGFGSGFDTYDDDVGRHEESGTLPGIFPERRASEVTDRALDWLRQTGQKRFFLWVHYYDPHAPYDPPEPYRTAYAKDLYSGEIAYVDEQVGRLVEGIQRLGLGPRTLIVAVGDHGESLGEHGEQTHGIFLYESTLRVPFIMAGRGVPGGKVFDEQVRSIDVMPTVLDFLHLPPGREAQGVSLWPLIRQGRKVPSHYAYLETLYPRTRMGWSELRGMRTDRWKLIVAPHAELYDLQRDPGETVNVIARYPADADGLQKHVWEVAGEEVRQQKLAVSPIDAETRQELESLGYVSAGGAQGIQLGTNAADPKNHLDILKSLEEAEALVIEGDYPRASQIAEWCVKRDPTNPVAHIYLASALHRMGLREREIAVYQHALKEKIETDQICGRLGRAYLRQHRLDKAAQYLSRAVEMNPLDLDTLCQLGSAYYQLGRIDDAERAFKAVTARSDRFSAAYDGLGLVAVRHGDPETARKYFERAIEVDSAQVDALLNLGILYKVTRRNELAVQYLKNFLEKAPKDEYGSMFPSVREAIRKCEEKLSEGGP